MGEYKKKSECPEKIDELIKIANADNAGSDLASRASTSQEWRYGGLSAKTIREQVRFLATAASRYFDYKRESGRGEGMAFSKYAMDFTTTTFLHISNDNRFRFHDSSVVEAFQGADSARLRICGICDEVFWAKKITAVTCGDKKCVQRQKYLNRQKRELASKDEDTK